MAYERANSGTYPSGLVRKDHLQGETDDEGGFEFSDVPLGAYGVAVKVGKKWQITLGAALGSKMKEGEAYDIGSIEIKDE